jgi:hypothetical protein
MKGPKIPLPFFYFLQHNQVLPGAHNPLVPGSSPGGPTMVFKGLGALWREVKGSESLGVSHSPHSTSARGTRSLRRKRHLELDGGQLLGGFANRLQQGQPAWIVGQGF